VRTSSKTWRACSIGGIGRDPEDRVSGTLYGEGRGGRVFSSQPGSLEGEEVEVQKREIGSKSAIIS